MPRRSSGMRPQVDPGRRRDEITSAPRRSGSAISRQLDFFVTDATAAARCAILPGQCCRDRNRSRDLIFRKSAIIFVWTHTASTICAIWDQSATQPGGANVTDRRMYDIAIIGGGVNGCGIARDAAGRGLSGAAGREERPGQRHLRRPRPSWSMAACAISSTTSSGWCGSR